jgi:hypothetical protein
LSKQYGKAFAWSVALFKSETWAIGVGDRERTGTFDKLVLEADAEDQMDGCDK